MKHSQSTMSFTRAEGAIYPRVYKNFKIGDEEFSIADLSVNHEDEALELLVEFVVPEENFCKAIQLHKNENAMKIVCENYKKLFQKKMSLACFKKDSGELVGLNILNVVSKDDPKPDAVRSVFMRLE